jgi:trimeric autotransporter adhesin
MSATQPSVCSEDYSCKPPSSVPCNCPRKKPGSCLRRPISIFGVRWRLFARIWFSAAIFALLMSVCIPAHAQVIDTIAGGFNGSALPSENACPPFLSVAPHGTDVYVAGCDQIFKVNALGQWSHVAGSGIVGSSPDGTPAATANFEGIASLSVDSAGNIYFNETASIRVREIVASTGLIKTVAGTGVSGFSGDGGPATSAQLSGGFFMGVFADAHGNVFIGDLFNHRVREVFAATGIIQTVAGNGTRGFSGDGGLATAAELSNPRGVFVDGAGDIFVADVNNFRIRRVAAGTGIITTVAGNGTAGFAGDGGPATSAEIQSGVPSVAVDALGNLFIADINNNRIREVVAATGNIQTIAGNGSFFQSGCSGGVNACIGVGGPATKALVSNPLQVALDASGNVYIPIQNTSRNMIEEVVASTGNIEIFAANGAQDFTGTNGPAIKAQLNVPNFAVTDGAGNVFIADANNNVIYEIVAATGILKIVAGTGVAGYSGDNGPATAAELTAPFSVVADGSGNLFIADTGNGVIREVVAATGVIETVAGNASAVCNGTLGDGGPATSASLCGPTFAALDSHGNIFVADAGYSLIREVVTSTGNIQTVAGSGGGNSSGYSGDGGPATSALLNGPNGVFVDGSGNLFIADQVNQVIREVAASTGIITTVAGSTSGTPGFSGDGGPAVGAEMFNPGTVWGDNLGNFYVADFSNNVIRKFTLGGNIQTIAGSRMTGFAGDGGPATSAELDGPDGAFVEPNGSVLIADINNGRIRIVGAATTTTLASSSNPSFVNQDVTFTATVAPAGGGTPIGSVNFLDNGSVIGTGSVNGSGQATFTTSTLATGGHPITAQYFGTNFPGSISSPLNQQVNVISGPLTISAGQTFTFVNANIPGNIVMNGGSLVLNNTTVGGNLLMSAGSLTVINSTVQGTVQITGGTFSIDPTHIKGNLLVHNIRFGSAQNKICGTTVNGNLQFQFNGTAVLIGSPSCAGNTVGGNLQVSDNFAATQIYGNTVRGNLQVLTNIAASHVENNIVNGNLQVSYNFAATQVNGNKVRGNLQVSGNFAATQVDNNKVTENLLIQNNIASTGVFFNVVEDKLQCSGNRSSLITGGGNKAEQKLGQCARF